MNFWVKLCGTTTIADAKLAADYGANYSGLVVEVPFSERSVTVDQAKRLNQYTPIPTVILVFDQPTDWILSAIEYISPFAVQLLGNETPVQVAELKKNSEVEIWKSLFMPAGETVNVADLRRKVIAHVAAGTDAILLDTIDLSQNRFGGTGKTGDWEAAASITKESPVATFLSGGINPQNVEEAIRMVQPNGIDLCSGVEFSKGKRDAKKVRSLMAIVKQMVKKT